MTETSKPLVDHKTPAKDDPLIVSFERHLRAERKDPDTVAHYGGATRQFSAYCMDNGLPALRTARREHVEMWLEALHVTYKPYTVRNRFIGLRIFYKWLVEDGEIKRNPMERIKPPSLEEVAKDVVSPQDMSNVFDFLEKAKRWRDCAVVAILYDTGMRASELADCRTEHVNLETGVLFIPKTKANRVRTVKLSPKCIRYLDRYLRQERAEPDYLINGKRGRMTRFGIYDACRRIFAAAGIKGTIGAHDLRHTSASHVVGVKSESEMMTLYGWADPEMARHYARQALEKAALDGHAKSSPLERLPKPKKG